MPILRGDGFAQEAAAKADKKERIAIRTLRSRKRLTHLSGRIRQAGKPSGKLAALLS